MASESSLDAAKTKVQWAEKHFGDFKDLVFGRSTGVDARKTTVIHYNLKGQSNPRPAAFLEPPRECRLAFGDAIHQLRSSLDHIVYALVKSRTCDPKVLRKIDFPIYINENLFKNAKSVQHLRTFLTPDQFTEVLNAQPYKRNPASPESEPLWVLSELDNIDKHRTILVVDPSLMTIRKGADGQTRVIKQKFKSGTIGFRLQLPAPDEVDVQGPTFVVVLSETGLACDDKTVLSVWRNELVPAVKETISSFEPFFV